MTKLEENYEGIQELLDRVQCPYRLYPSLIKALEFLVNQDLMMQIQRTIISQIPHFVRMEWLKQFMSDFEVFGLYEAILYFHTYPFTKSARDFIREACELYHSIASIYMAHHREIADSDDPRIQAQLATIRFKGAGFQHVPYLQMPLLSKPNVIQPPSKPPIDPEYTRQLPLHKDYKEFLKVNTTKGPGHLAYELIEHLDSQFMFEDFPGLQLVFFKVTDLLLRFNIEPFNSTGQYVLLTIIKHMKEEYYGDFVRWVECINCGQSFMPKISLSEVNLNLINGGWVCKQCRSA